MFLKEHAEDFYSAYEVLDKSNQTSMNSLTNLSAHPPKEKIVLPVMGPAIVCLAFSVELYIKYLHYAINRKAPRGHNILELFKKLPESVQQDIFNYRSIADYGWSFSEFEKQIHAISDGFEKWRYSYEVSTVQYNNYFALVFIKSLYQNEGSLVF